MSNPFEFFVGYLPIPSGTKQFVRVIVGALCALTVAVALLLVIGQHPFAASTFEFQQPRDFSGVLVSDPYPALAIQGENTPWLLVGPGKHGVNDLVRGLHDRRVRLKGMRIMNGADHMIELIPRSLTAGAPTSPEVETDLGPAECIGEIVDTKCYFGVMNPGNGKVHRDCAARCISGGIPPALLVRDAGGRATTVLLSGSDGRELHGEVLNYVAEPVIVHGRLIRSRGRLVLRAEPRDYRRYRE